MNNGDLKQKQENLEKAVKARIKGLGLDALFHQVDTDKKEEKIFNDKFSGSTQKLSLLQNIKTELSTKRGKNLLFALSELTTKFISHRISTKLILDIGTSSIKLIELKYSKDAIILNKVTYIPIPYIVTTSQNKLEKFIIKSLAEIVDLQLIKKASISTLLPRSIAIVKFITLPTQDSTEIKKMIEFEIKHHLPISLSEIETDYHIIKRDVNGTKLMLVAIKKDEISKHLSLLGRLEIRPHTIEISAAALYNYNLYSYKKGILVQINIGATYTDINIVKDGVLSFSRGIDWGSKDLTLKICQTLNVRFDDAERIKKENGILLSAEAENSSKKSISDNATNWADYLIYEINRTMESFQLKEGTAFIDQIILSGGGAKLINLNKYLVDKLKTRITMQEPIADILVSSSSDNIYNKYFQELNLLLGLAWEHSNPRLLKLNLLPQKIKHSLQIKTQKVKRIVLLAEIILTILFIGILPLWIISARDKQIEKFDRKLKELNSSVAQVQDLKEKIQTIEDYLSAKNSCMEILRELSIIVPIDTTINSFAFEKNKSVTLIGTAQSHASAVNFSEALSKSHFFESAKLRYTRKKDIPGKEEVDFEIICILKNR
jgi:type IV pilus assembly protein PilM